MGFVIKNNEVQRAKKIVLSKKDRKIIFTQTTKQKEILKEAMPAGYILFQQICITN